MVHRREADQESKQPQRRRACSSGSPQGGSSASARILAAARATGVWSADTCLTMQCGHQPTTRLYGHTYARPTRRLIAGDGFLPETVHLVRRDRDSWVISHGEARRQVQEPHGVHGGEIGDHRCVGHAVDEALKERRAVDIIHRSGAAVRGVGLPYERPSRGLPRGPVPPPSPRRA